MHCNAAAPSTRNLRTWEVTCTLYGKKPWPYAAAEPKDYVCIQCRVISPEKRDAARARVSDRRRAQRVRARWSGFLGRDFPTGSLNDLRRSA